MLTDFLTYRNLSTMQVTLHSNKPQFARSYQCFQALGVTTDGHSQIVMNVYEIVTQKIVDQLEKGCIPWKQPWHSVKEMPQNLISRKEYHGVNWLLTISSGYASPFWLTYKQAQAIGGQVRKGGSGLIVLRDIHQVRVHPDFLMGMTIEDFCWWINTQDNLSMH